MRRLVFLLGVLGVLWTGMELVAPGIVEGRLEDRVRQRTAGAVGVQADIDSFPFVTRLALSGRVRRLTIRVDEVVRQRFRFADLVYTLEGLQLDRGALLRQEADVESVDSGEVRASLGPGWLSELVGAARVEGLSVDVSAGRLRLSRRGTVLLEAELPSGIFPCAPEGATTADRIVLRCVFDEVPEALVRVAEQG